MEIDQAYVAVLALSNIATFYFSRHLAIAEIMAFFDRHRFFTNLNKEENRNE